MASAAAVFPVHAPTGDEEQRVLLQDVPWAAYVVLRDAVESPGVRMTYLEGALEIMRTSRAHEVNKTQIARLLELFCLERDIPLFGYGSTTFRKEEAERGLEPDECYCRGEDKAVPPHPLGGRGALRARGRARGHEGDPTGRRKLKARRHRSRRRGGDRRGAAASRRHLRPHQVAPRVGRRCCRSSTGPRAQPRCVPRPVPS